MKQKTTTSYSANTLQQAVSSNVRYKQVTNADRA